MKLYFRALTLVLVVLVVGACEQRVQPFYNPSNIPVPNSLTFTSLEKIGEAIKQAGTFQNWKMTDIEPGKIEGVYRIRTHKAIVQIDYSTLNYSITYVSSINLLDDGIGIHRNYNKWVRNLEATINANLEALARSANTNPVTTDDKAMLEAWERVQNSNDPLVLQDFMDEYGDGPLAELAQKRLDELARLRTGSVSKFDPTGLWRVAVSYQGGNGNSSWCGKARTWNFTLDLVRGKISRTVYDFRYGLHVRGENSEDLVYLHFDYPAGGSQWEWTERFKLDQDEIRMTLAAESGAPSGCTGSLGVHMKKVETIGSVSNHTTPPPIPREVLDPTGLWQVNAKYNASSGTSASCIQIVNWSFTLDFHRGIISKTVYSGRTPLHLNGENNPGHVDLRINVPAGGTLWRWNERFVLDGPDKIFRAESPSGGGHYGQCHGVIGMRMKKID